jgi:uncharacterized protein (TIGR03067 family)
MKTVIRLSLVVALGIAFSIRADDAKKETKFDASKLEGKWTYVSGKHAGEASEKDKIAGEVVVTKDSFVLPAGTEKFTVGFKIDAKGTPVKIDMEIKDGPFKDAKAEGLIELNGDEFKLCYNMIGMGGKRPEKFESNKDNGAFLFVLKRVK